jgi:hypothetical protein
VVKENMGGKPYFLDMQFFCPSLSCCWQMSTANNFEHLICQDKSRIKGAIWEDLKTTEIENDCCWRKRTTYLIN